AYWLRTLAGAPTVLKLPTDQPRPAQQDYSGSYVEFALHEPLTAQLKALSRRGNLDTSGEHDNTVVPLAAWPVVPARLTGPDKLLCSINQIRANECDSGQTSREIAHAGSRRVEP
ncbi:hypothetical protein, partial [Mesorhizobium shangrilense]